MSKKLAVIISSIAAAVVAVVGVVFASVWGTNQPDVNDNTIEVGKATVIKLDGTAMNETGVKPGDSVTSGTYTVSLEEVTASYKLVLTVTGASTANLDYWTVAVGSEAATAVTDGMVLDATVADGDTYTFTFTFDENAPSTEAESKLIFNLSLVEAA